MSSGSRSNGGPAWQPSARERLWRLRAHVLRQLRAFFDGHGLLEVETPIATADGVVDRHLDPLSVVGPEPPSAAGGATRWLQTSPEFAMKRLLAAGAPSIYQITRAFRAGERGPLHNPEFTIVEWYQRGQSFFEGMEFLSLLAQEILQSAPAECLTYREAFRRYLSIDIATCATEEIVAYLREHDVACPASAPREDRDFWLDLALTAGVEPHLGQTTPTIMYHYPPSQAALAQVTQDEAGNQVAERFELYVRGLELANGYHELLDPVEFRHRQETANQWRRADGKLMLQPAGYLIEAMVHGLPACTGVALGLDRLLMVLSGAQSIDEVLAFPWESA